MKAVMKVKALFKDKPVDLIIEDAPHGNVLITIGKDELFVNAEHLSTAVKGFIPDDEATDT